MTNKTCLKLSLLTALFFLLPLALAAQEQPTKLKKLPLAVQKTVEEQSKDGKIRGISREVENGRTQYELELRVAGHTKDILIDPKGEILEVEEEISLDSLPPTIRDEVQKNIAQSKLIKLESVTKSGVLLGYEAHIAKGVKGSEIKLGPDGKLLPQEKKSK